jgi:hypothetical protein
VPLCELCNELEVWSEAVEHGHAWCENCSYVDDCGCECHGRTNDAPELHVAWETDHDMSFCPTCRRRERASQEMQSLEAQVRELAEIHEWDVSIESVADTGSRYLRLERECGPCILGSSDECDCETLAVRISDHGSCYCREDLSLVIPSGKESGDDHTVEELSRRLARRPPAEAD